MSKIRTGATGSQGHSFSQIATAEIPRSTFDRSSTLKTTFNGSDLIPIFCDELLPGDTINLRQRSFIRLQTVSTPAMEEIIQETQYFFIPLRLIHDDYAAMMGEQPDPDDSIDFVTPQMVTAGGAGTSGTLSARLGIPIQATNISHSSLYHRAYALCFNDWYRDANLQDRITVGTGAGPDTEGDYLIQKRGKRKDLFTSCLPWPQRGDPINLVFDGIVPVIATATGIPHFEDQSGNVSRLAGDNTLTPLIGALDLTFDDAEALQWETTGLEADLSTASANTVNGLRGAFAVQRLLERDARGGARLTEILQAHFKVTSPDHRLQRPEYLGGNRTIIGIEEVKGTSFAAGGLPGDVGGLGRGSSNSSNIIYSATEHGLILGISSVRAPISYQQGLNKKFSRDGRYDHFWPAFSHIGEQAILNKQLYAQGDGNPTEDAAVFGYNEAWSDYRYRPNEIGGEFLSEATATLDIWHLAYDFAALPTLDASFIEDDTPFARIMAVDTSPYFLADFAFDIKHTRPMPTFSTPGLMDHF